MEPLRIISADSHVTEPGDMWLKHMPANWRDRAPRVVRRDNADWFICEGRRDSSIGVLSDAGTPANEIRQAMRYEEVRQGAFDPDARVEDLALDGVEAEIIYPSLSMHIFVLEDAAFQRAAFAAYNDWIAAFCATHPRMFHAVGLISLCDPVAAAKEVYRVAAKGLSGLMIRAVAPETRPYSSTDYDPFWAAAEEIGLPVSLHVATGIKGELLTNFMVENTVVFPYLIQRSMATLIFSGVLDRFPRLKLVSAENDIGWIGNFLERMDYTAERHRTWAGGYGIKSGMKPSDIFRRNVWASFMRDHIGVQTREAIGVDNIMWASDYPHVDATWPDSRRVIEEHFRGLPEAHKRKIVGGNVARLYNIAL